MNEDDFIVYQKLKRGFEVSDELDKPIDKSFSVIQQRIANNKRNVLPLYRNWGVAIAASIVLFFGLFSIFGNSDTVIKTGFGENKIITLLDGSEVILNSKSIIAYNEKKWETERTLTLDGEAYFKVKKGSTFTVKTINGSITVLGTQFNVNSRNDFFDVVCYEGKVGVKTLESDHILIPTNSVRKINGYPSKSSITQVAKPTWIDGESTFKSVPIKYVITALENQYNIKIDAETIDDTTIFSGSFPNNNLNVALITVFEALHIKYNEKEKRNIKLRY